MTTKLAHLKIANLVEKTCSLGFFLHGVDISRRLATDLKPHVGGWRGVQMEREVELGVEVDMDLIFDFRVAVGQLFGLGQRGGS